MKKYDVVIVGAATSGAYFACKMAKKGYTVKVIEKLSPETLGTRMDIFHVSQTDLKTYDMPQVKEGDPAWAFEFTSNHFSSPTNQFNIPTTAETVGLHMHEYVALMVKTAEAAGAEFEYNAAFREFIFENGVIGGIRYETAEGIREVFAKTVVDCSGSAAAARCALPNGYGVENFRLTNEDMFYVILRYAEFPEKPMNTFWLNTKSWYAPFSMNENQKIIGTGATGSYERAQKDADKLDAATGDTFETLRVEKGTTPYRRPPYSLVADNFIAAGDAACLTKPECGEGVTSAMVMMDIAADALDGAFKKGDTSKASLWSINRDYNRVQGADFSLVRAFLTKVVNCVKDEEIEYCFKNGIVFNSKFLDNGDIKPVDILKTLSGIIGGISKKNISKNTLKGIFGGIRLALALRQHYLAFPATPEGFEKWCAKSDKLWEKVGKIQ